MISSPGHSRLRPLVAIVGPTASGKSALGVRLAEKLAGEVVCCDSTQVYRGFDIGTAKPTATERRGVAHHLLDILEPTQQTLDALMKLDLSAGVDVEIKS